MRAAEREVLHGSPAYEPIYDVARHRERFMALVDVTAGPEACWPWKGTLRGGRYPVFSFHRSPMRAGRFAYRLFIAELEDRAGQHVVATCKNVLCVQPRHLRLLAVPGTIDPLVTPKVVSEISSFYYDFEQSVDVIAEHLGLSVRTVWSVIGSFERARRPTPKKVKHPFTFPASR